MALSSPRALALTIVLSLALIAACGPGSITSDTDAGGTLSDSTTNTPDTTTTGDSGTAGAICGDGVIEAPEQCEGADLSGNDCTTLGAGFDGGTLGCSAGCAFDTSACTSPPTNYVIMETGYPAGAPGSPTVPGGLASATYLFPLGSSFTSFDYLFTINDDPGDTTSYFWAGQFFFTKPTGIDGGYLGVQTNGYMSGVPIGKMIIFSVWNAVDSEAGPGAACEAFGGEGTGLSCRMAYPWMADCPYRFTLSGDVTTHWWEVWFEETCTGTNTFLGRIQTQPTWGGLVDFASYFAEYYGTVDTCMTLPYANATVGEVIANGAIPPVTINAMPYGTCVGSASVMCVGSACP